MSGIFLHHHPNSDTVDSGSFPKPSLFLVFFSGYFCFHGIQDFKSWFLNYQKYFLSQHPSFLHGTSYNSMTLLLFHVFSELSMLLFLFNSCLSGDNCRSSTALISPFRFGRKNRHASFNSLSLSLLSPLAGQGSGKRYRILFLLETIALAQQNLQFSPGTELGPVISGSCEYICKVLKRQGGCFWHNVISAHACRASPSCWGPTQGQVLGSTVESSWMLGEHWLNAVSDWMQGDH